MFWIKALYLINNEFKKINEFQTIKYFECFKQILIKPLQKEKISIIRIDDQKNEICVYFEEKE